MVDLWFKYLDALLQQQDSYSVFFWRDWPFCYAFNLWGFIFKRDIN